MKLDRKLETNKSPILKKMGQALKKAVTVFCILGALTFVGYAIKGAVDNKRYTSTTTITETLEELGVENVYLFQGNLTKNYRRLANNGNEPIYVAFSKEFENDNVLKDSAIKSLDYLFGIVGEINPSYKYKVVSYFEMEKQDLLGKSTIKFELGSLPSNINGENIMNPDMQDIAYWDFVNTSNRIVIDKRSFYKSKDYYNEHYKNESKFLSNKTTNLLTHELMHVFGFADVYEWDGPEFIMKIFKHVIGQDKINTTTSHKDTFMDTGNVDSFKINELTTQDYATLCALYMQKLSPDKQKEEISRLSKMVEDYQTMLLNKKIEYYQKEDKKALEDIVGLDMSEIGNYGTLDENVSGIEFSRKVRHVTEYDEWFENDEYTYKLTLNGSKYCLAVCDKDGNIVDSCDGDVVKTDHFTVLERCSFKNWMPTSISEDYVLDKNSKTQFTISTDMYVYTYKGKPKVFSRIRTFNVCKNITYQNEASME